MAGVTVGKRLGSCFLESLPSPGVVCVRVANRPCLASCFCEITVMLENVPLQMNAPSWWQCLSGCSRGSITAGSKALFLSFLGGNLKFDYLFNFGAEERC